ncbi:MAG: ABC transporter ATP-binding protein [Candidatus Micrarchaeia archaeon]
MILEVQGVSKAFGGLIAVNNVTFNVKEKEIFGVIGPNGSGKTTLFNLISGFLRTDSGKIIFNGEEITNLKASTICKKGICKTFQLPRPFNNMSTIDNVMVGALLRTNNLEKARNKALEIIKFVGLEKKSNHKPFELTMAERKILELSRALATEPRVLLLDEVMAGLNPTEIEEMLSRIKKLKDQGITILMIEHVMRAVMSICDRIMVLHHGEKIAEGKPVEIAENEKVIEAYLGARLFA